MGIRSDQINFPTARLFVHVLCLTLNLDPSIRKPMTQLCRSAALGNPCICDNGRDILPSRASNNPTISRSAN